MINNINSRVQKVRDKIIKRLIDKVEAQEDSIDIVEYMSKVVIKDRKPKRRNT